MKDFPIKEYQFIQVSEWKVVLRLKEEDYRGEDLKNKITKTYARFLPDSVSLVFEPVSGFQKTTTGKFLFVYKKME
jgi:hypothetical protein